VAVFGLELGTSWRIDCEIDRLPAVIITIMRSPGISNTLSLRNVPTWSTPALVRESDKNTSPAFRRMPTQ
jgi:hypothetical protein